MTQHLWQVLGGVCWHVLAGAFWQVLAGVCNWQVCVGRC